MVTSTDGIELPVYTSIFRLRRRLYRVYDIELPVPVSLPQVAAFVAGLVVVVPAMRAIGIEASPGSAWVYLVPPGAAAWLANRPVADDRSALAWLAAHARFVLEPKVLVAGAAVHPEATASIRVRTWERRRSAFRRARSDG